MTTITLSPISTEYVRVPISATEAGTPVDPTSYPVDMAFVATGEPATGDWHSASWETAGTVFYARILVGPAGGLALARGTYTIWVRITAGLEQPVQEVGLLVVTDNVASVLDPFCTVDELERYMGRSIAIEKMATAELLLQMASGRIRTEARQTISLVSDDVVQLHPQGAGHVVQLPQVPVVRVSNMQIFFLGIDGPAITVVSNFQVTTWGRLAWLFGDFASRFPVFNLEPADSDIGGVPPLVQVTYTHGYDPIPDDVKGICLAASSRAFLNPEGLSEEQMVNYRAIYGDARGLALTKDEIATLRDRYRLRTFAGAYAA